MPLRIVAIVRAPAKLAMCFLLSRRMAPLRRHQRCVRYLDRGVSRKGAGRVLEIAPRRRWSKFAFEDAWPFQQLFTAVAELCGLKDKWRRPATRCRSRMVEAAPMTIRTTTGGKRDGRDFSFPVICPSTRSPATRRRVGLGVEVPSIHPAWTPNMHTFLFRSRDLILESGRG